MFYDLNVLVVPSGPMRALITLTMLVFGVFACRSLWNQRIAVDRPV
ncbi:hypothetical protein ACFYO1_01775 [Nocardia sp. NPDC006044]